MIFKMCAFYVGNRDAIFLDFEWSDECIDFTVMLFFSMIIDNTFPRRKIFRILTSRVDFISKIKIKMSNIFYYCNRENKKR